MSDHSTHLLPVGGCATCDDRARAIGYAAMGISPPIPAGGNGGREDRSYLFDLGNSSDGPLGLCVRIIALTEAQAIKRFRASLPSEIDLGKLCMGDPPYALEYANVYLNPDYDYRPSPDGLACAECGSYMTEEQDRCLGDHAETREEHPVC